VWQNRWQELGDLLAKVLAHLKEEIHGQPKKADHDPDPSAGFWKQRHGDQGEGKWVNKLGHNPAKNSKDFHLESQISANDLDGCPEAGGICWPAQRILHHAEHKGTEPKDEL